MDNKREIKETISQVILATLTPLGGVGLLKP